MSPATPPAEALAPRIPGLELHEQIGEGGAGVVYKAVHRALQRTVAVKLLPPAEAGPAWLREPRLMAALVHPHVVAVHDAGQCGGHGYLVLEYMAGGSLRARMLPGRPWLLADAVLLLDRVAAALEYIHGQGILHLDLKPENILYAADGQAKVADFGLSVPHDATTALLGGRRFRGTLDYCAPEVRTDLGLDARCDVFSLATIAYELLTGRLPGRVYVPASRHNPRLPPTLDDVLRRGLARDPDDRHASVTEFRQALEGACRKSTPRVPLRVLGLLGCLAALVTVALVVIDRRPTAPTPGGMPVPRVPDPDRPDRLALLYDRADDRAWFAGLDGGDPDGEPRVAVERFAAEMTSRHPPTGIPLPVWPTPGPVLVVRSPRALGLVHPLQDRSLGQRVVRHWPALLRAVVPPEQNLVRAGGFDEDCLSKGHEGGPWRGGDATGWDATRQITLDRPTDRGDNPALLLTNLDLARSKKLLGCYQSLVQGPPPGAVVVLRYRARSLNGRGSLAVYAGMPVVIPEEDTGPAATRVRALADALTPEPGDPVAARWRYRCPGWVTPTKEWQTYIAVCECPPFPTQALHRNLVIDLAGADQVWVDDVELFVWRPGGEP